MKSWDKPDRPAIAGTISAASQTHAPDSESGSAWSWSVSKTLYVIALCGAVVGLWTAESATGRPLRVPLTPAAPVSADASAAICRHTLLGKIPQAPSVHAATITTLPDGDLLAAWFGGSREGAKDVCIYTSTWDHKQDHWAPARRMISADEASRELGRYVKKLGNPVLHCDRQGRVWLFYVTVSLGGWSGSSISYKYSDDLGYSWSESERLITTPFLNISTLVRGLPLELDSGQLLLPVYHELLTKYGELLHLSRDGQLLDKYRMGEGETLQASIVARSERDLLAFHRSLGNPSARVLANRSEDGGASWTDPMPIDVPNPNASVAVARRPCGGLVMALNACETERRELSLAVSQDGKTWRVVQTLPPHPDGSESSYPTLLANGSGEYHLVYTWGREQICHTHFNDAWLEVAP